jgi:two-component system, NarL family, nitrate/nitrite response regulator NarL
MASVRLLIVDPHQLSREGLRLLLAGETYHVIGAVTSLGTALIDIEGGGRPDLLVVVSHGSRKIFSSATLQQVQSIVPGCKVVVIANTISSSLPAQVRDWGANALLHGDMSSDDLIRCLRLVLQGAAIFPASSAMRSNLLDESTRDATEIAALRSVIRLSDREGRVLRHLLSGDTNKTIARELAIDGATVKVIVKAILRKLNVRNRTQAAIWAKANSFPDKSRCSLPKVHSQVLGTTEGH